MPIVLAAATVEIVATGVLVLLAAIRTIYILRTGRIKK